MVTAAVTAAGTNAHHEADNRFVPAFACLDIAPLGDQRRIAPQHDRGCHAGEE